jgi:hypothetical protein
MSDVVTISFRLGTTNAEVPLGFEAWVDDQKFFDTDHVQLDQQIQTEIAADDDAEHELRLVLKNKIPDHTKVDQMGNIISDARLVINDLSLDEIALEQLVPKHAVYTHDQNAQLPIPVQDKFYGEMGCNGTVSLKFATPVYLWLLEHM